MQTEHHPHALLLIKIETAARIRVLLNSMESRGGDTENAACLGRCRFPSVNDP